MIKVMNKNNSGLLHHLEIYVSNLKRSSEFWGWFLGKLGYKKIAEWDSGQSWELESTYIVFVQTEDKYKDVPFHRCRTGLNHLAFHANYIASLKQEEFLFCMKTGILTREAGIITLFSLKTPTG